MILFIANSVAGAAMGFLVLRRGRDRSPESIRSARWLRMAGLIPLGLQAAIFLLFGVGEMVGGDPSGAGHLLQMIVTVLPGILAWMRPLEGGVALFIAGLVISISLPQSALMSPAIAIMAAPQVVSGVLLFIAGMLARRATTLGADQNK